MTGKIQLVYKPGIKGPREANFTDRFTGLISFFKAMYRAYKSGATKVYIFFD